MHKTNNILLLADKSEKIANLCFLLRLSNIQTVQIANDTEAFNFLVHRQNSSQPFDLLLITEAKQQQPILRLINDMERNNAMLPIVLFSEKDRLRLTEIDCYDHLKQLIRLCPADTTHSRLLNIFNTLPDAASTAS